MTRVAALALVVTTALAACAFDPDPEFAVIVENPCTTAVTIRQYSIYASGGVSSSATSKLEAESSATFLVGLSDSIVVVEAPSLGWEDRAPAGEVNQPVVFRIDLRLCP